jgi:hypothetical protein
MYSKLDNHIALFCSHDNTVDNTGFFDFIRFATEKDVLYICKKLLNYPSKYNGRVTTTAVANYRGP